MTSIMLDRTDGLSSATAYKGPCRVATIGNITLSGEQTIDGVAIVTGDRVLVRAQTSSVNNGIYVADTGLWRRAKDFAGSRDVRKGTRVWVTEGDTGPAEFEVISENPILIGTSAIMFELSAGSVNAAALSAAAERAEEAADIAEGLASSFILSENTFDTKATAAAWSPVAAPNFIRTAGALAADDGSGVVFVQGAGNGGFSISLSGGGTQAYKPAKERGYDIRLFGAGPARTAAQNSAALVLAMSYTTELWVPPLAAGEYFDVNDEVTVPAHVKIRGAGWHSRIRQTVREKNVFILSDHSSVEGCHLIGDFLATGADFTKNNGIYASGKKGIIVQNNFIERFEGCGIQLRACKDYKITGNTCFANLWGAFATSGDIVLYSGAAAGRAVITGNHCLSNNSQGIYADTLGFDADIIIQGNIVVTLDPLTCVEGGTWSEAPDVGVAPSTLRRRHGIGAGYNSSSVAGPRCIISGNICRNTLWAGIYKQGYSASGGGVLITGNYISKIGADNGNSLSGGIYANVSGEDAIIGNFITDFRGVAAGVGLITLTAGVAPTRSTKVQGNFLRDSLGQGISVGTYAALLDIQNNDIAGCTTTDIYIVNATDAGVGGNTLRGNKIKRGVGNTIPSIRVSTPGTALITRIYENEVEGFDKTNAVSSNVGITTTNMLITRIYRNKVSNFHVAIQSTAYFAVSTRHFDVRLHDNDIDDCTTGFGLASTNNTAVVPVIGNRFTNVTNKTAASTTHTGLAGTKAGYICRKDDDRLVVLELAAAPAVGTWAAGDRAEFPAPAAAAAPGAVCTAGGNPGTWNAQAAIAA